MRTWVWIVGLWVWAAALGLAAGYDTTVMVMDAGGGAYEVAVAYDRVVDHKMIAAGVGALARATGAGVTGLAMREDRLVRGEAARGTSVEFRALGLLRGGAPLPVEALARALPDWQRMRIAFFPGPSFRFAGPGEGAVGGGRFRRVEAGSGYEYDVARAVRPGPDGSLGAGSGPGRGEAYGFGSGIRKVLVGVAVLLLALAAWIVWSARRDAWKRPRG